MINMDAITNEISQQFAMEIARTYNVLASTNTFRKVLSSVFTKVDLASYTKFQLHSLFNEIILNNYYGELFVKSLLVDYFIQEDVVAAFEIKTNNSRLDFLQVNGSTISYEIKSAVDNLQKLKRQIEDYTKLFEYNYVVIGKNHLSDIRKELPEKYGIYIVEKGKLREKRKALKNSLINPKFQLSIFTKKELIENFNSSKIYRILKEFSANKINVTFREVLKRRYYKKWQFLFDNKDEILPVDYQYFYHHNITPSIIYGQR